MYLGANIGIAIRGKDLEVVCLRGRWRSLVVTGFLRLEDYQARPVAEVAAQYQRFRREHHALATSATVALPRGAGLIRTLELPAEVAPNLAQAVAYQVDSLHPFEEGAVYFDYSLLPRSSAPAAGGPGAAGRLRVAVVLVEKKALDPLYDWLCRAGIDVAAFTLSTAGLYQALAGASGPAAANGQAGRRPVVLLDQRDETTEILGIAPDGAFCSREAPAGAPLDREVQFCAAELRLKPEEAPRLIFTGSGAAIPIEGGEVTRLEQDVVALPEVRPATRSAGSGPDFRLREHFPGYAAALAGLERRLPGSAPAAGLRWNLLPAGKRIYRSQWAHAAAYVLAALLVALGAAWLLTAAVQDRLYASWLDGRARALRPRVEQLDKLDSRQKALLARLEVLNGQQQDIARKLEAWQELTRLLPPPGWLQMLHFTENQVVAQGVAESASALLQAVNQSPHFTQAEFVGAISKNNEGREVFHVRMRLREMAPAPAPAAAAAVAPAPPPAGPAGNPPGSTAATAGGRKPTGSNQ